MGARVAFGVGFGVGAGGLTVGPVVGFGVAAAVAAPGLVVLGVALGAALGVDVSNAIWVAGTVGSTIAIPEVGEGLGPSATAGRIRPEIMP